MTDIQQNEYAEDGEPVGAPAGGGADVTEGYVDPADPADEGMVGGVLGSPDPARLGYDTEASDLTEADPTDTYVGAGTDDPGADGDLTASDN